MQAWKFARPAALGAIGMLLWSCASQPKPEPATSAAIEEAAPAPREAVAEEPECVDDEDKRVECLSDGDCCSGFVCGKDPELNPRVNYCVYGG